MGVQIKGRTECGGGRAAVTNVRGGVGAAQGGSKLSKPGWEAFVQLLKVLNVAIAAN